MKKILVLLIFGISFFSYILYEAYLLESKFDNTNNRTNAIIKKMPNIKLKTLAGEDKTLHSIKELKFSDYIFVHFWASWCLPCIKEFPQIIEYIEKTKSENLKYKFIFITLDTEKSEIKKFLSNFKIDYKDNRIIFLQDTEEKHKLFGTYQLPETYIFNNNLDILKRFSGYQNWDTLEI